MSDSYDDYETKMQLAEHAWEQALEEKQEPVAWASSLDFNDDDQEIIPAKDKGKLGTSNCDIPLYTTPPKQWVGLIDDEIYDCEEEVGMPQYEISSADLYAFARAIEAKLKEKNGGEYRNGATTERTKLNQENT
jgi:hypothetical protein